MVVNIFVSFIFITCVLYIGTAIEDKMEIIAITTINSSMEKEKSFCNRLVFFIIGSFGCLLLKRDFGAEPQAPLS
jgi:hypothetical protein